MLKLRCKSTFRPSEFYFPLNNRRCDCTAPVYPFITDDGIFIARPPLFDTMPCLAFERDSQTCRTRGSLLLEQFFWAQFCYRPCSSVEHARFPTPGVMGASIVIRWWTIQTARTVPSPIRFDQARRPMPT